MNNTIQDDLDAVRNEAQRLLRQELDAERLEALLDKPGSFDMKLWQLVGEQGWPAVGLPESDEGSGLGWAGLAVLCEELGRSGAALPLVASSLLTAALVEQPEAHLKQRWLAGLRDGSQTACLVFPGASEGQLDNASAVRSLQGRLQGFVSTVAFAAGADLALVAAEDEQHQLGLWLLTLDAPQVSRDTATTLDDARGFADLRLTGAPAQRLGDGNQFAGMLDRAAALTAFEQIGGAQAALALAIEHAMQREAFGQPIARFQAIKHKLVEIYGAIEIARGCALAALELLEIDAEPGERHQACAAARIAASQAHELAARDCINIFGALGLTREAAPHRHYRRSRALALELGSTAVWRESLVENFIRRSALAEGT